MLRSRPGARVVLVAEGPDDIGMARCMRAGDVVYTSRAEVMQTLHQEERIAAEVRWRDEGGGEEEDAFLDAVARGLGGVNVGRGERRGERRGDGGGVGGAVGFVKVA